MIARRFSGPVALVAFVTGCTAPLILAEPAEDDAPAIFVEPPSVGEGTTDGAAMDGDLHDAAERGNAHVIIHADGAGFVDGSRRVDAGRD